MIKLALKRFVFAVSILVVVPLILIRWIGKLILGKYQLRTFTGSAELLSLFPTIIGIYLRKAFYWATCKGVSADAQFLFGCLLNRDEVIVRKGAVIGHHTFVGYADIGENVQIAARVSIISGKYQHGRPSERTAQGDLSAETEVIYIGKNTWIGQEAVILANVGENCTIGAGSVVLKDIPDNTTVLGNPARKVNL